MPNKNILIALILLTVLSLFIGFATTPNKDYQLLVNALSINFVISSVFYFLVVYIPEIQRRNRVFRSIDKSYREFKLSCIHTFLILSNSQEYTHREMLLEQDVFRRYFSNTNTQNQDRWSAVMSGIEDNGYYLREVLYELRMLNEEIRYVRNNIDIHDEEVFDFLNRLSQIISRMDATGPDYEDIKSFSRFLWELFSGWSFVEGYRKSDLIKDMIDRI